MLALFEGGEILEFNLCNPDFPSQMLNNLMQFITDFTFTVAKRMKYY
jgi:hypothetical protein